MEKLRPALGLFDAVNVALGAIIGAGIFVILGAATAISGPAVFISVIVAGAVAILTGLTSAELSRLYPTSGGAYTFAKESISDFAGFLVGWMWLFSNTVLGATVAVGFGYYLAFFFPGIPQQLAVGLVLALTTIIQLTGAKESSLLNNVLVGIKVLILLFFVGSAVFFFKPSNFEPLLPFGLGGVLAGAATIFFAYSGFARVAVIADEIKDPEKTVPRATILSITISTIIYVLVAAAAVGVAGYEVIGASKSPLASAMESESISFGSELVAGGALIATGTVLLTGILGVSRLAFTMSSNGELPRFLRDVDPRTGAPRNAIMLSGLSMPTSAASPCSCTIRP
jgi:APA family basic amino acid/polyamine antiporter